MVLAKRHAPRVPAVRTFTAKGDQIGVTLTRRRTGAARMPHSACPMYRISSTRKSVPTACRRGARRIPAASPPRTACTQSDVRLQVPHEESHGILNHRRGKLGQGPQRTTSRREHPETSLNPRTDQNPSNRGPGVKTSREATPTRGMLHQAQAQNETAPHARQPRRTRHNRMPYAS